MYEVGGFAMVLHQQVPVAAPTPTAAANVISLFSGAYTDLVGTNWNPN
jgi:hypothetical protein